MASDLVVQFSDDFQKQCGAPDGLGTKRWINWQGTAEAGNGQCRLTPETDGFGLAGIGTREKQLNPGLKGANGFEVDLVGFSQRRAPEFNPEAARASGIVHGIEPLAPHFITGFALTIADRHGQIGCEPRESRGVQLHFDMIDNWGLEWWLVRSLVPGDYDRYPQWDLRMPTFKEYLRQRIFISEPCLGLAVRHYDPVEIRESPFGHRLGLYLTDDGDTLSWTFDGEVRDTADITGFFSSCPEAIGGRRLSHHLGRGPKQLDHRKRGGLCEPVKGRQDPLP